jgi:acyl-lipid omega-6 desaturase (Delta-12 desaturase)
MRDFVRSYGKEDFKACRALGVSLLL